jgi:hypothetical protein
MASFDHGTDLNGPMFLLTFAKIQISSRFPASNVRVIKQFVLLGIHLRSVTARADFNAQAHEQLPLRGRSTI